MILDRIYGLWCLLMEWLGVKDRCEACHGQRGGAYGNENVIDGHVLCDDCSVEYGRRSDPRV